MDSKSVVSPLSPKLKKLYTESLYVNTLINMSGGFIGIFDLNTSYLVKTAALVTLIASMVIYNKFAKLTEASRVKYMEAIVIGRSLVYLMNPEQANKFLIELEESLKDAKDKLKLNEKDLDEQALSNKNTLNEKIAVLTKGINDLKESNKFFQKDPGLLKAQMISLLTLNKLTTRNNRLVQNLMSTYLVIAIYIPLFFNLIKYLVNKNSYSIIGTRLAIASIFIPSLMVEANRYDQAQQQDSLAIITLEALNALKV